MTRHRAVCIALLLFLLPFESFAQRENLTLPSPSHLEWADAEIGVIIHFDINVLAPSTFDYSKRETLPNPGVFNPTRLNTDQWLEAAKAAGARYAILVAKHGTGFCLWPTKAHDYHVGRTPWRNGNGDIVRDFIASCKKYGVSPGLYYNTNVNTYLGAGFREFSSDEQRQAYNRTVLEQLAELWTTYGALSEIWFDGGVLADEKGGIASKVYRLIANHQPRAILFQGPIQSKNLIRWVGNEDGRAPYPHWSCANATTSSLGIIEIPDLHGDPDGAIWCPAEADFPNRKKTAWNGGWLWKADEEEHVFPVEDLVDRYYTSVGQNANMLIGMVIDTAGLFPRSDAEVFAGFGSEIKRRFSRPVATTSGSGSLLELILAPRPAKFNHIVLMEDIAKGERIRRFTVEALLDGKWKTVCDGQSIGHKLIRTFPVVETTRVRFLARESADVPHIRRLSVLNVE